MGYYDKSCALSGAPIKDQQEVYLIPIISNVKDNEFNADHHSWSKMNIFSGPSKLFQMVFLPIKCLHGEHYDDILENDNTEYIESTLGIDIYTYRSIILRNKSIEKYKESLGEHYDNVLHTHTCVIHAGILDELIKNQSVFIESDYQNKYVQFNETLEQIAAYHVRVSELEDIINNLDNKQSELMNVYNTIIDDTHESIKLHHDINNSSNTPILFRNHLNYVWTNGDMNIIEWVSKMDQLMNDTFNIYVPKIIGQTMVNCDLRRNISELVIEELNKIEETING